MLQLTKGTETYLAAFAARAAQTAAEPAWLAALRQKALARFAELGFPTVRLEDWKYTNVAPIVDAAFPPAPEPTPDAITAPAVERLAPSTPAAARLVFVDGWYAPALSHTDGLPAGVQVLDLAAAARALPAVVEEHLGRYADFAAQDRGYVALNTAFIRGGACVYVPAGRTVEAPIELVWVARAAEPAVAAQPRTLVVLERGASATVVERYVAAADSPYLANAVSELVLGDGAILTHYKLLRENARAFHVGTTAVCQRRDSVLRSFSLAMGAALARNDLHVVLSAPGADCTLDGLYVGGEAQHVDNHTAIDHAQPHGTSRQLYKGVLNGRARAVFNGKVFVRPGAQHTDAQQTNKNLLLSEHATVDTKPQLEILADDVKCSHGAAIGQLDAEALFYLRSRGIGPDLARQLLTYGFASEVLDRLPSGALRDELHHALAAWLRADALATEIA
jgi:Fe-S cluster assembly protein SufD